MMRWVLSFICLGLVGCAGGAVREPVQRVTLSGGLEISWPSGSTAPFGSGRAADRGGATSLVVWLRCVGDGPVVVCCVLRADHAGRPSGAVFVREPEPARFRYDRRSDTIVAEPGRLSPFSLAPVFRWYDLVLHPGGERVTVELGQAQPGSTVGVLVEYMSLGYGRLASAGYVASDGAETARGVTEEREEPQTTVTFSRLSEVELRRKRPGRLFLRTGYLPPATKVPLEILWGSRL